MQHPARSRYVRQISEWMREGRQEVNGLETDEVISRGDTCTMQPCRGVKIQQNMDPKDYGPEFRERKHTGEFLWVFVWLVLFF